MPDPLAMQQMWRQMQQMMGMWQQGMMQQGLQPGSMGAQVQEAWDGQHEGEDCQNEGDGVGWGPSTNPAAFSAGSMKYKGKGGRGKGTGQAWAPY